MATVQHGAAPLIVAHLAHRAEPLLRQASVSDAAAPIALPGRVLHLAGGLTAEVLGFLGPALAVLDQAGVEQVLIAADPGAGGVRPRGLAPGVEVVLARPARGRPGSHRLDDAEGPLGPLGLLARWHHWRAASDMLVAALRETPHAAVHVHGFIAALVAFSARRRAASRSFVYYSPHGSASLGRLRPLGWLLQWVARWLTAGVPFHRVITSCEVEARLLPALPEHPVDAVHVAESPVPACFFVERRQPAEPPLVLAGVLEDGVLAAQRVARLAVLLGDEELRVRVRWVGVLRPASTALLRAAGIQAEPPGDNAALAAIMGQAWIFVAPVAATHSPLLLAQAMATGLPCVAFDSPFHGALLADGETGFLCKDLEQMLRRTRELIESQALRDRLGRAARREAERRFDEVFFRQALLQGYSTPTRPPGLDTRMARQLRPIGPGTR